MKYVAVVVAVILLLVLAVFALRPQPWDMQPTADDLTYPSIDAAGRRT